MAPVPDEVSVYTGDEVPSSPRSISSIPSTRALKASDLWCAGRAASRIARGTWTGPGATTIRSSSLLMITP